MFTSCEDGQDREDKNEEAACGWDSEEGGRGQTGQDRAGAGC